MNKPESKALIIRYLIDQNKLGNFPNSDIILKHLTSYGADFTPRTLQRHLRELRDANHIDYNERYKTYSIDEEHLEKTITAKEKWERSMVYETMLDEQNFYHPNGSMIIAFEAQNNFKGSQNIAALLEAIKNNRVVTFTHIDYYGNGGDSDRKVGPLFLKEYLNRWYLMAWDLHKDDERLFGIDRITNLKVCEELFEPDNYFERCWNQFEHVIGLRYSHGKDYLDPMDLVIRSLEINVPFLDSLPLHHSQTKIKAEEGSKDQTRYHLKVVPNFELEQRILSLSNLIEVEKPLHYRNHIKKRLQEILGIYS